LEFDRLAGAKRGCEFRELLLARIKNFLIRLGSQNLLRFESGVEQRVPNNHIELFFLDFAHCSFKRPQIRQY